MRGLYYRLRYAEYRHPRGLALFADRILAACLLEYARVKDSAASRIQRLKERMRALGEQRAALDPDSLPSFEETLRNARQLRFEQVLWLLLVGGECALTYFAALVFLPGRGLILALLRLLIATIATCVAVVVAEKAIDEFLAAPNEADTPAFRLHRRRMWCWGVLLLGLECTLWGLASIRAADMEGTVKSPVLYLGLVLLSVLLAPAAGGIRHDMMRRLAPVRRAQKLSAMDAAIEETTKQLSTARHNLESRWEAMCQEWYSTFADFRAHKEIHNLKRQVSESTTGTYFDTRALFCAEARLRRDRGYGETSLLFDEAVESRPESVSPTLMLAAGGRVHEGGHIGRRGGE